MADADRTVEPALAKRTPAKANARKPARTHNPQDDWGEAMEGAVNHARRPAKAEAKHGQGKLTRQATKDIISRRS